MPPWRRKKPWLPLLRRLCAGVALLSYCAVAVGLPFPQLPVKDRSIPFICQNRACGCQSADDCWRHCCCFTPEERHAWAHEHGVTPPANAEQPRSLAWNRPRLREQAAGASHEGSCSENSCCHHEKSPPREEARPEAGKIHWFLGMTALHCRGLSTVWVTTGSVAPMPPPVTWSPGILLADVLPRTEGTSTLLPFLPPDPPPRLFAA
jgi:hypothetical protein